MAAVARFSADERRARLAPRHRLAPSARVYDDVAAIARSVVALHAPDPMTVVLDLGANRPALFDAYGNAAPTIWVDGRAVGAWAQRPDGEVVTRLLEDVGAEREDAIAVEAARTQVMLGSIVMTPRFNSALSRDLGR